MKFKEIFDLFNIQVWKKAKADVDFLFREWDSFCSNNPFIQEKGKEFTKDRKILKEYYEAFKRKYPAAANPTTPENEVQVKLWPEFIRARFEEEQLKKGFVKSGDNWITKFEAEQRDKGLGYYEGEWLPFEEIKRRKEVEFGLRNNFAEYLPFEFEKFIAKLFTAMGYNTEVTKQTGDYGIDVIARKGTETIAIQVKKYEEGNNVGNRDVQRLLGAMRLKNIKADKGILVTTSDFTVQAQAEETPIELWNKRILHEMVRKFLIDKTITSETKNEVVE